MTSRRYGARLGTIPALPQPFRVIAKNGIITFMPRYGRKSDALSVELSTILRVLKDERDQTNGQHFLKFTRTQP